MNELSAQQRVQENTYALPYHYIPVFDGRNFSQTQTLSWGYEYLSYLHFVLDHVKGSDFRSLFDVGCGDGRFLSELRRTMPEKKLTGIDYSRRAIDLARAQNENVEWICGDVGKDDLFSQPYDVLTLIETLEHIDPAELDTFLSGLQRRLTPDGQLIITVPSKNIRVSAKHYQHFNLETLTQVLKPYFHIDQVYYVNIKKSPMLKLMKLALSNRIFILNNKFILHHIFSYYMTHLFHVKAQNCRRIIAICTKSS